MKGLFAAVVTPVHADGRVDEETFERVLEVLLGAGVDGICLGGATSEYPHFDTVERTTLLRRAARLLPPDRVLLAGIGASSLRRTLQLGEAAVDAGTRALLLPMPMFFRYEPQDLQAYCAHVSRTLRAPCLLYDLPDFTNPVPRDMGLVLLRDEEFIVGLKDSSGRRENLAVFAAARGSEPWTLLVGDDRLLQAGVRAGWNGGISGVAGFCPELLLAVHRSAAQPAGEEAARLQASLEELIARISVFPVPWGVRIGLSARGIDTGPLPLPLTAARRRQVEEFQGWFQPWFESLELPERPERTVSS